MLDPKPGGSEYVLMPFDPELSVTVHLPPVGYGWDPTNKTIIKTDVLCRSSVAKDQWWERPAPPADYEKKSRREKRMKKSDPDYYDPELAEYRAREWHRRLYGCWVMINGRPVYLTGTYYFYLAHWKIDIGFPEFRIADAEFFYFWDYCVEDPRCYGVLEVTKRRGGKTYRGTCIVYEYCSRTKSVHGGIQSKTGPDAKDVFSDKLVQPWRQLVDFFRPEYDRTKSNIPKSELRFFKTAEKGRDVDDSYNDSEELGSWIDFTNSGVTAYDGKKLARYMCDEIFKTEEVNILKRHNVNKPCMEDTSRNIIGKAIYTSTVEEMGDHMERYVTLWDQSSVLNRNPIGQTASGLYRYFTPAQRLMHIDRYGYPDEQRALEELNMVIDSIEDPRDRADFIRKNPRNWKEAFRTSSDNCIFNPIKIDDQLSTLQFIKEDTLYRRYNLIWDETVGENETPRVILVENKNGRYYLANDFVEWFEASGSANDVLRRGSEFLPKNTFRFIVGVDPFDHNRTRTGKFSQGAAAIYMKFDPLNADLSDNFVGYYLGRPSSSAIFYDDMVKLCVWLSCQMLFEDNKPKIGDHFIDNGFGGFLLRDEKGYPGIPGTTKTHQVMFELLEGFIEANCHRVKFHRMVKDWKDLDPDYTNEYDLGMATGYALIGNTKIVKREKVVKKVNQTRATTYFRKYTLRNGNRTGNYTKFSKPLR